MFTFRILKLEELQMMLIILKVIVELAFILYLCSK